MTTQNPPLTKVVLGIYATREAAEEGVRALKESGFWSDDISVLSPDHFDSKELAQAKSDQTQIGAYVGGGGGAVVGGAIGWMAGMVALAIPGLGPFLVAGPLLGALAGAGVGGVVGEVGGALVGMGVTSDDAKKYESRLQKGEVLLSVHSGAEQTLGQAEVILRQTGAQDVVITHDGRLTESVENLRRDVA
jgi:hypothetical protein